MKALGAKLLYDKLIQYMYIKALHDEKWDFDRGDFSMMVRRDYLKLINNRVNQILHATATIEYSNHILGHTTKMLIILEW